MKLQLRLPESEKDLLRVVELMNMVSPEPISMDTFRDRQRMAAPERISHAIIALDEHEVIVGYISIIRQPWMPPGHFWLRMIVDPALRMRGIGTFLYDHALSILQEEAATHLISEVSESCAECLQFVRQRGFSIERHLFVSRLYLSDFEDTRFAEVIEAVEAAGIRLFTFADIEDTLEARLKLYELYCRCVIDNPATAGWNLPSFEHYCKRIFESAHYRPECLIIAADGKNWVGIASVAYYQETNSLHNGFTGVDRIYRGRHIALALKLLAIRFARQLGVSYLYTNNDSTNGPMLAINSKLGYKSEPGIYMLSRDI